MLIFRLLSGFLFGGLIGLLAWRAHALSKSGAIAATFTGGLIFGLGGMPWAVLLMAFFISSSALSKAFARRKASLGEKFAKGSVRDWGQVLANGGLGALLAVGLWIFPGAAWPWLAYAGAMAAVNADTWATELGVLNPHPPRMITSFQRVERGTSGAVSLGGTISAAGGALFIALCALPFTPLGQAPALLVCVTLGGLFGSAVDSLLGATLQAIYFCPACQKETERHPFHLCGTHTSRVRGLSWMDNDVVNFICSLSGALAALAIWLWLLT